MVLLGTVATERVRGFVTSPHAARTQVMSLTYSSTNSKLAKQRGLLLDVERKGQNEAKLRARVEELESLEKDLKAKVAARTQIQVEIQPVDNPLR